MPEYDFSLLAAAFSVNTAFRTKLVNKETRAQAISQGYLDESFNFNEEELQDILNIDVAKESDFGIRLNIVRNKHYPKDIDEILRNLRQGPNNRSNLED